MEESDNMLITSLKEYIAIPNGIQKLRDINTEHIFIIINNLFEELGIEHQQLKNINKAQRFRSMTKLTQAINAQLDGGFQLNDIMNPSTTFLRKFMISIISKIGSSQLTEGKNKVSQNKGGQNAVQRYEKQKLKNWVKTEWIMPELDTKKSYKNQSYKLKMGLKKDIFKRNIANQLSNIPGNAHNIIQSTITQEKIKRKKKQADEGINRKQQQQISRNIYQIIKNNQNDWQIADRKKKKLKKNLLNQIDEKRQQQPTSIFQKEVLELQLAAENKKNTNQQKAYHNKLQTQTAQTQQFENPLQKMKRQCDKKRLELEAQLQEIINLLNSKKDEVQGKQLLKRKLEEQISMYEDRVNQEIERRPDLKKSAEKMKIMVQSLQAGQNVLANEVKQLEQQYKYLQNQANKQINSLQSQIIQTKKQGQMKLTILKQLKMKLAKIQMDYQNITEQIAQKQEIKSKVKINKSGISRLYYNKKISEMQSRWRQTQKQANKICKNLQKQREQIRRLMFLADRSQTQIQNIVNSSRFKDDIQNKSFKQVMEKCKKAFKDTIKALQLINTTKTDIQQYEAKVHTLSGKQYPDNVKKIRQALEQLTKEISQFMKKSK